jgi:formiminoglutamase
MIFKDYFDPIEIEVTDDGRYSSFARQIKETDDLVGSKLAIIHVPETRYSQGSSILDFGRLLKSILRLYPHGYQPQISILGSLKLGAKLEDTESAVSEIVAELVRCRTVPVIIGGDRELTYSLYKSFELLEEVVNIASIDPLLNLNDEENSYLGRIVKTQPNYLFNYSNLGFQTYYVSPQELIIADELYFDCYRLGELRGQIVKSEPIIRGAEIFTMSLDSIKSSDFSSSASPQPNGFYAEEACQTIRYAGLGEKLKAVLISDLGEIKNTQDEMLISQMIWCLIDGLYARRSEIPNSNNLDFLKYRVSIKDDEFNLIFYKSLRTDRWWMEVPVPPEYGNRYRKHHLIPCDYQDYQATTNDDLPDRWWRAYKKMI